MRKWLFAWLLLMIPVCAQGAELVATVDHDTIGKNEMIVLSVRMTGSDANFRLDTRPLDKDFYVTPKGSGHVAGAWREKRFQLGPKHTGVLSVPALTATFQGKTLKSRAFTVSVRNQSGNIDDARLWIETHVDRHAVWQRQQVVYRFTVYSTNPMVSPHVTSPDFGGFQVQTVEENTPGEQIIAGRRVHTAQYVYLLFPRQAGSLRIEGPTMKASLQESVKGFRMAAGQASIGDDKQIFRTKVAQGPPQALRVRALPPAAASLPVGVVRLHSGITEAQAVAGEPLTWTVTIRGLGISGEEMPDLKSQMRLDGSFKVYAETPEITLDKKPGGMVAKAVWREVMLPQKPGDLSLPAIAISYFDPRLGRIEKVAAAAINLKVSPAPQSEAHVVFQADPSRSGYSTQLLPNTSLWWKWIAAMATVLWLLTLALWLSPWRRIRTWMRRGKERRASFRRVLAAQDASEQFVRLRAMLGLPARLSPLGLLEMVPELQGDAIGAWLVSLERGRYAAGERPPPLDDRAMRRIRALLRRRQPEAPVFYANQFGRIGAGR